MPNISICPHCKFELPRIIDAFCPACHEELGEVVAVQQTWTESESVAAAMAVRDATHDPFARLEESSGADELGESRICPMCGHTVGVFDPQCANCGETHFGDATPDSSVARRQLLHPVGGVVWAALCGGPLAAGIILAINYTRLGKTQAKWCILLLAVVATGAVLALAIADPEIPRALFVVPQMVAVYVLAKHLQGDHIRRHARNGGRIGSAWRSVGIGLVSGVALSIVLIAVFAAVQPSYGTVVKFGADEIYYSGDATEDDARQLAKFLQDVRIFGHSGAAARLEMSSEGVTISLILDESAWKNQDTIESFRVVFGELDATVFPGPLTIQLCDKYFSPQTSIVIR